MRGDSRRDLYAKALALCGLGVLAGVGAVVDYWPVAIRFPAAQLAVGDRLPAPLLVPDDAWARVERVREFQASSRTGESARPLSRRQTPARTSAMPPAPVAVVPTLAVERWGAPINVAALMPAFEAPAPAVTPLVMGRPGPRPATLVAHLEGPAMLDGPASGDRLAADGRDTGRGMFGTAVRVTGRSLARSGAVTGASVADAFRAVGGLFRRALPD